MASLVKSGTRSKEQRDNAGSVGEMAQQNLPPAQEELEKYACDCQAIIGRFCFLQSLADFFWGNSCFKRQDMEIS